jgi:hypothetical protein
MKVRDELVNGTLAKLMVSWLFCVPSPNGDIVSGRSKSQFGLSE